MALGLWWLWVVLPSPIHQLVVGKRELSDWIFVCAILPMMAIPGALALVFGFKLWRTVSLVFLKRVIAVFACFGAIWIWSKLSSSFGEFLPRQIKNGIFVLIAIFVGVPAYLAVVARLSRKLGLGNPKAADLLGRGILTLAALQLWLLLSALFQEYSPREVEYTSVPKEPLGDDRALPATPHFLRSLSDGGRVAAAPPD